MKRYDELKGDRRGYLGSVVKAINGVTAVITALTKLVWGIWWFVVVVASLATVYALHML